MFTDCEEDNKIKIEVKKDLEDITEQADKVTVGKSGSTRNVKFLEGAEAGSYTITAFYNSQQLAQQPVTIAEKVEPIIEKYGFALTPQEVDSVTGTTFSSDVPQLTKNIFYFYKFKNAPTTGENHVVIIEVDEKKYALPLWNTSDGHYNFYVGLSDNVHGTFVNESGDWNENETPVDSIETKTVKLSLYQYDKKIDKETLATEPTKKIIDGESINCSQSTEKGKVLDQD